MKLVIDVENMSLGKCISFARFLDNKTQRELSAELGIKQNLLSMYEKGQRNPKQLFKMRLENYIESVFSRYYE